MHVYVGKEQLHALQSFRWNFSAQAIEIIASAWALNKSGVGNIVGQMWQHIISDNIY